MRDNLLISLNSVAGTAMIEITNDTDFKMLSFKVTTGKSSGKCLNQLIPEYGFFSRGGSNYINIDTKVMRDKVCTGKFPCSLNIHLESSACGATAYGAVNVSISETNGKSHLNFNITNWKIHDAKARATINATAGEDYIRVKKNDPGAQPRYRALSSP